MHKRTRLFLFAAAGVLVLGLGTGLLASYMGGLPGLALLGPDGPDELAYVPADAQMVAFANVRDMMDSELRQRLKALQSPDAREKEQQGAASFKDETGIDIETDVDQVVASVSAADRAVQRQRPLVIARGRFDVVRIEGLVRQHGGAAEDYKGTRIVTHPESGFGVAFLEPGMVAVGTPSSIRRAVETKATGRGNVKENADVMRLVRDVDDGNAWAVARFDALTGGSQLPSALADRLPPISWFSASGHVNGGVRGVLHAETRDDTAAQDLREVIRGFVALARMQAGREPQFAGVLSSLELGGQGNTVSLGFSLPPEMLDLLSTMRPGPGGMRPNPPEPPPPPPSRPSL